MIVGGTERVFPGCARCGDLGDAGAVRDAVAVAGVRMPEDDDVRRVQDYGDAVILA